MSSADEGERSEVAIVAIKGLGRIISCLLFIHCPTTWSVVGWGIVIVVVVIAINANRST
jgi:hypothetical protein